MLKSAKEDSVYWTQILANGASAAAPSAGTVKSVTVKGYCSGGTSTILFQVLRPQPDGSLLVVETSQPFTLPNTPGTYTFEPTGMTVQAGDFIGIATLSGSFLIGTSAPGAATNDFSGHEKDRNGDAIRPTTTEPNVELLLQVDLVPPPSGGGKPPPPKEEKPPPKKPCKCQKISVALDPTLINKRRVRSDQHDFGVGFTWRMTCSKGNGGCAAVLDFLPPVIRAGSLPKVRGLKLNLTRVSFACAAACQKSTTGRFEIKMTSRQQLNKLFGRTLAFTIVTHCSGATFRYLVNVFVDKSGRLHASH